MVTFWLFGEHTKRYGGRMTVGEGTGPLSKAHSNLPGKDEWLWKQQIIYLAVLDTY